MRDFDDFPSKEFAVVAGWFMRKYPEEISLELLHKMSVHLRDLNKAAMEEALYNIPIVDALSKYSTRSFPLNNEKRYR